MKEFLCNLFFLLFCSLQAQKMVVQKPVINLWRDPAHTYQSPPRRSVSKKILDSQLLSGERVVITEKRKDGWIKVQALDQPGREGGEWKYYYGWIAPEDCGAVVERFPQYNLVVCQLWASVFENKEQLLQEPITIVPIGSQFKGIKIDDAWWSVELGDDKRGYIRSSMINEIALDSALNDDLRQRIVATAKLFVHAGYRLGARCVTNGEGIDCSALINIIFKAHGFRVPRNARSQFALSRKISPHELKQADLIFVKYPRGNKKQVVHHVILYLGDGMLIEATGFKPNKVQIISFEKKFGVPLQDAHEGMIVDGDQLFFSSFLVDQNLCKQLRTGWFDPLSSIC